MVGTLWQYRIALTILLAFFATSWRETHAKPLQAECHSDGDCKKKEVCVTAEGVGMYCAEYSKKCDGYRWTKRAPESIKGKCVPEPLPPGAVPDNEVRNTRP